MEAKRLLGVLAIGGIVAYLLLKAKKVYAEEPVATGVAKVIEDLKLRLAPEIIPPLAPPPEICKEVIFYPRFPLLVAAVIQIQIQSIKETICGPDYNTIEAKVAKRAAEFGPLGAEFKIQD